MNGIGAYLLAARNSENIYSCKPWDEKEILVVSNFLETQAQFKSLTLATATTTSITTPDAGGSIVITDYTVTTDKAANSSVTFGFTDDTDTENILIGETVNQSFVLTSTRLAYRAWRDARVFITNVGAITTTVTLGYVKLPKGLVFTDWDALR